MTSLEDDVSIILITSPSPSNPSTYLIDSTLSSIFNNVQGVNKSKVIIILDGCVVSGSNKMKKGKVTSDAKAKYDSYYDALKAKYCGDQFILERMEEHKGFALAVKHGLEVCRTKYAMICQHDRAFQKSFNRLEELMEVMEIHKYIRYIGFPTVNNNRHDETIASRYFLGDSLNVPPLKLDMPNNMVLQPLMFWYDSQHLCHVERYKRIYRPYLDVSANEHMAKVFSPQDMKDMLLRAGDFIEDRLGQVQRRILHGLQENNAGIGMIY